MKYQVAADGVTMDTVPDLCTGLPKVSADAKVFTFTIRQGVYFQPPVNTEVTAQDFVASWNAVANPKNWVTGTPAYILEPIVGTDETGAAKNGLTGVKALDKWTLQVTLKYPFAEFPASLGHPILSVWPVAYAMKEGLKNFDQKPIGTGPYMLSKWVHNQEVDLAKNPHWWNASATNGPFVDTIHMPEFTGPLDRMARLPGRQHRLHLRCRPGRSRRPRHMAAPEGLGRQEVAQPRHLLHRHQPEGPGPRRRQEPAAAPGPVVLGRPQRGHQHGQEGVPLVPNGVVPVGIPGSNLSTLPYPYDPAKAKAIVQGLGTVPTLKLWYNTGANHDKILAPVQAGWQAVGLNVTMTGFELGHLPHEVLPGHAGPALPSRLAGRLSVDGRLPVPALPEQRLGRQHVHLLLQPDGRQAARHGARHGRPDTAAADLRAGREA